MLLVVLEFVIFFIFLCLNNFFFFENFFVLLYFKKVVIFVFVFGNIFIMFFIIVDFKEVGNIFKICFLDNKILLLNFIIFFVCLIFFLVSIKICDIEKSFISVVVNGIFESNVGILNVK